MSVLIEVLENRCLLAGEVNDSLFEGGELKVDEVCFPEEEAIERQSEFEFNLLHLKELREGDGEGSQFESVEERVIDEAEWEKLYFLNITSFVGRVIGEEVRVVFRAGGDGIAYGVLNWGVPVLKVGLDVFDFTMRNAANILLFMGQKVWNSDQTKMLLQGPHYLAAFTEEHWGVMSSIRGVDASNAYGVLPFVTDLFLRVAVPYCKVIALAQSYHFGNHVMGEMSERLSGTRVNWGPVASIAMLPVSNVIFNHIHALILSGVEGLVGAEMIEESK